MKKVLTLAVLTLAGTANALTIGELFGTSETTLASACNDGYRIESMPRTGQAQTDAYTAEASKALRGKSLRDNRTFLDMKTDPIAYFSALIGYVDIQTPAGSAFNICGSRARKLAAKPEGNTLALAANTLVYIAGDAKERKLAEDWNAVLAPLDEAGNELGRLQATSASRKGQLDDWKPSCTSSGCKWVGRNVYYFNTSKLDPKAVSLRLIFTRGKGIEQRDYKPEDFLTTYLSDPKATP